MFKEKTKYRHKNYPNDQFYDIYVLNSKPKTDKNPTRFDVEMVLLEPESGISLGYHHEPNFPLQLMKNYFELGVS